MCDLPPSSYYDDFCNHGLKNSTLSLYCLPRIYLHFTMFILFYFIFSLFTSIQYTLAIFQSLPSSQYVLFSFLHPYFLTINVGFRLFCFKNGSRISNKKVWIFNKYLIINSRSLLIVSPISKCHISLINGVIGN